MEEAWNAMSQAIDTGDANEVVRLLETGISVNVERPKDEGELEVLYDTRGPPHVWEWDEIHLASEVMTALNYAVIGDKLDIVRCLLDNGADPNSESNKKSIHFAVRNKNVEIVKILIERGADVNWVDPRYDERSSTTALAWAVKVRNQEIVRLLLEAGCEANARTAHGGNILLIMAFCYAYEMIPMLLDYGADPAMFTYYYDSSRPIEYVCACNRSVPLDMVELLFEKTAERLLDIEVVSLIGEHIIPFLSKRNILDKSIYIKYLEKLPASLYAYYSNEDSCNYYHEAVRDERGNYEDRLSQLRGSMESILDTFTCMKHHDMLLWLLESKLPLESLSKKTIARLTFTKSELPVLITLINSSQFNPSQRLPYPGAPHFMDIIGICLSEPPADRSLAGYQESNHAALLQLDVNADERDALWTRTKISIQYLLCDALPLLKLQYATGIDIDDLDELIVSHKEEHGDDDLPDILQWIESKIGKPRNLQEMCIIKARKCIGQPILEKVNSISNREMSHVVKDEIMLRYNEMAVL